VSKVFLVGAVSLLMGVGGCATQADLQQISREQSSLRPLVADQRAALEGVRQQVEKVRGDLEEIRHHLQRVAKSKGPSFSQFETLEKRVAAIEGRPTQYQYPEPPFPGEEAESPGQPEFPPVLPAEEPPPTVELTPEDRDLALEPVAVQDEYRLAWQAMTDGQFDKAIRLFRSFVRKYSRSRVADDALYRIGECHYAQRKYYDAILAYNDVLRDYGRGDRASAALLRQAFAFNELGNKIDARVTLKTLIRRYPNTAEAEQAKETLQTLGR